MTIGATSSSNDETGLFLSSYMFRSGAPPRSRSASGKPKRSATSKTGLLKKDKKPSQVLRKSTPQGHAEVGKLPSAKARNRGRAPRASATPGAASDHLAAIAQSAPHKASKGRGRSRSSASGAQAVAPRGRSPRASGRGKARPSARGTNTVGGAGAGGGISEDVLFGLPETSRLTGAGAQDDEADSEAKKDDVVKLYGFRRCVPGACLNLDRKEMPHISISEALARMKTGDLIFVSGKGQSSKRIREWTQSFYSHIAMIVEDPPPQIWEKYGKLRNAAGLYMETGGEVPRDKRIYLFDSDFEEDDSVNGPTIRGFEDMLHEYVKPGYHGPGVDVVLRQLSVTDDVRAQIMPTLWDFALSVHGKEFTAQKVLDPQFYKMALGAVGRNKKEGDGKRLFCSQLIYQAYQKMGLIGSDSGVSMNFMPQDFASPNNKNRPGGVTNSNNINDALHLGAQLELEARIDLASIGGVGAAEETPNSEDDAGAAEDADTSLTSGKIDKAKKLVSKLAQRSEEAEPAREGSTKAKGVKFVNKLNSEFEKAETDPESKVAKGGKLVDKMSKNERVNSKVKGLSSKLKFPRRQ